MLRIIDNILEEIFRDKFIFYLIVASIFLTACGDESSDSVTSAGGQFQGEITPYSDEELEVYRAICVDENLWPSENNRQVLEREWERIKRAAFNELEACVVDFRTLENVEFCYAHYERFIDFEANLCKFETEYRDPDEVPSYEED